MKSKLITISVNEVYEKKIKTLSEVTGKGISELVRSAIDVYYRKEMVTAGPALRTPAPSRLAKAERDSKVEEILSMSDEELTTWLLEVGFSPAMEIDESTGQRHYFEIYTYELEDGLTEETRRKYCEVRDYPANPEKQGSRSGNLNMSQLIKYLKKAKIIK